jgi:ABC-type transport system involved in multi-copper enzyme maturation permease subunit
MLNLMRAEWLKLARRPLTWILLAAFLVLMLFSFAGQFIFVGLQSGTFGGLSISFLSEAQFAQWRGELSFPGVFGGVLGQANSYGGICAIVLAAGALGSEYSWGTLRIQLARQPQRGRYLLAKLLVILLLLLVGLIIGLLVGSLVALLTGSVLGDVGRVSAGNILLLLPSMLRALYVMLPYILFTLAACIFGRSVLAGVAGGLVFLFLDGGAAAFAFLANVGSPLLTFLLNLTLQRNITTLTLLNRTGYGFDPAVLGVLDTQTLPPLWQAVLMVGLYSAIFLGAAYYLFTRRDIGGAA